MSCATCGGTGVVYELGRPIAPEDEHFVEVSCPDCDEAGAWCGDEAGGRADHRADAAIAEAA